MAAGAQTLHPASAVPLISPFELQHQIFREHPAPEQLFLIATSRHCCPCLYINIYSVPRTEHQSPALLPPPVPGRASPAASPSAAARRPQPGRSVAVPRRAPGAELGWTHPHPVPCARSLPLPCLPAEALGEERPPARLSSPDAPLPTSGSAWGCLPWRRSLAAPRHDGPGHPHHAAASAPSVAGGCGRAGGDAA